MAEFDQVDVFSTGPFTGNPVAVIHNADGLTSEQMQTITLWQNLSETTFVLKPTNDKADYRVRIFAPEGEFPFAGHPTLGTAAAVLSRGLVPKNKGKLVQECGVGLVDVKIDGKLLYFKSPKPKFEPYSGELLPKVIGSASIKGTPTVVDLGIRWLVIPLESAEENLAVRANVVALTELQNQLNIAGIIPYGPYPQGGPAQYEVRALLNFNNALVEDPVCGSGNAAVAQYLASTGKTENYQAQQGLVLGRRGAITVVYEGDQVWVGGGASVVTKGEILP